MWDRLLIRRSTRESIWRPSGGDGELSTPPLLIAARIKARIFLKFLEHQGRYSRGNWRPQKPIVEDFNRLRDLVLELDPKLIAVLPPTQAVPSAQPGSEKPSSPELNYTQLIFFCRQIVAFLE